MAGSLELLRRENPSVASVGTFHIMIREERALSDAVAHLSAMPSVGHADVLFSCAHVATSHSAPTHKHHLNPHFLLEIRRGETDPRPKEADLCNLSTKLHPPINS